jgi:hypothetical protein
VRGRHRVVAASRFAVWVRVACEVPRPAGVMAREPSLHDAAWRAVARQLGDAGGVTAPRRCDVGDGVASYAGVEVGPHGVWMTATSTPGEVAFVVERGGKGAAFSDRVPADGDAASLPAGVRLVLQLRAARAMSQIGCPCPAPAAGDGSDATRGRWESMTPELLSGAVPGPWRPCTVRVLPGGGDRGGGEGGRGGGSGARRRAERLGAGRRCGGVRNRRCVCCTRGDGACGVVAVAVGARHRCWVAPSALGGRGVRAASLRALRPALPPPPPPPYPNLPTRLWAAGGRRPSCGGDEGHLLLLCGPDSRAAMGNVWCRRGRSAAEGERVHCQRERHQTLDVVFSHPI